MWAVCYCTLEVKPSPNNVVLMYRQTTTRTMVLGRTLPNRWVNEVDRHHITGYCSFRVLCIYLMPYPPPPPTAVGRYIQASEAIHPSSIVMTRTNDHPPDPSAYGRLMLHRTWAYIQNVCAGGLNGQNNVDIAWRCRADQQTTRPSPGPINLDTFVRCMDNMLEAASGAERITAT